MSCSNSSGGSSFSPATNTPIIPIDPEAGLVLSQTEASVLSEKTFKLFATLNGELCNDVYWTSSDKNVAIVTPVPNIETKPNTAKSARFAARAVSESDLIGTWNGTGAASGAMFTFKSGGNGNCDLSPAGVSATTFTWTISGNSVTITPSGAPSIGGTINGNTMTLNIGQFTKDSSSSGSGGGTSGGSGSGGGSNDNETSGSNSSASSNDNDDSYDMPTVTTDKSAVCIVGGALNGFAIITAQTTDYKYSAFCIVTVTDRGITATGMTLNKDSAEISEGGKTVLRPKFTPANATDQSVTWTSSDENIATVDEYGIVTAVAIEDSTATITAKSKTYGYTASCEVKVNAGTGETKPLGKYNADEILGEGWRDKTYIKIPDGITKIDYDVFANCNSLRTVVIPDSVRIIEDGAFKYCSSLTNVVIPPSVKKIGSWAFNECYQLTSVTIPEGITKINDGVFNSCASLTKVVIPKGVTEIDYMAFHDCSSLTKIVIPEGVTRIGREAFKSCSSLASIAIPEGVTEIGILAFGYCENLASVTIPNSVKKIGNSAFSYCKLTSVVIPSSITAIGSNAFYNNREYDSSSGSYIDSLTSVTFRDTQGWSSYDVEYNSNGKNTYSNGTTIDVSDASVNAKKLNRYSYYDYDQYGNSIWVEGWTEKCLFKGGFPSPDPFYSED